MMRASVAHPLYRVVAEKENSRAFVRTDQREAHVLLNELPSPIVRRARRIGGRQLSRQLIADAEDNGGNSHGAVAERFQHEGEIDRKSRTGRLRLPCRRRPFPADRSLCNIEGMTLGATLSGALDDGTAQTLRFLPVRFAKRHPPASARCTDRKSARALLRSPAPPIYWSGHD
jgi:hypothetical protein